ncbi:MAG: hypothetical protein IT463_05140 [Planctomycetes bacterium]|nr:hypothetical protein [Planctomycetota bacterium]
MGRVQRVVNRNGEVVPFRRNRVVRAILAAVRSAGTKDEWVADKLADMVVYFLDVQHGDRKEPPTADDVDDMIEKALLSVPDLGPVAQAFLAARTQRRELAEIEHSSAPAPADAPAVTGTAHGLGAWNRGRIAAALVREHGLAAARAAEIAQAVEQRVRELHLPNVTTGLVRELADVELLTRGLAHLPGAVAVPRWDIEQWLFPGDETELPPVAGQAELAERAARRVLAEYALQALPSTARDAHLQGRLHFEHLDAPLSPASLRLDAAALLKPGAGFGLLRVFSEAPAGVGAAFARLAAVLAEVSQVCAGPVALRGLDTALAALLRDDPEQLSRPELAQGLRMAAAASRGGLALEVGPAANVTRDLVIRSLLDTLAGEDANLRRMVTLELAVSAASFAEPARRTLLESACRAACFSGVPAFRFREPARAATGNLFGENAAPVAHEATLARAALNLVAPALEPGGISACLARLDTVLEQAAEGLAARVALLERAALRDLPEPVPACARMLRALVGSGRRVALAPVGLAGAATLLAGVKDPLHPEAQRAAQQVLSYAGFKFRELAAARGLDGHLEARPVEAAEPRFAREDLARLARTDPENPARLLLAAEGAYRSGAGLPAGTLAERLPLEAPLHSLLERDAELTAAADEPLAPGALLALLRQCVAEHGPRPSRLALSVRHKTCRDCGARYTASLEACPVCGSTGWALAQGQRSLFE